MMSRREFVAGSVAVPFLGGAGERARWVLMGTDKGRGLYRAAWDAATGTLGPSELAAICERPAFAAMHPRAPVLFVANEANVGDGWLSTFHVDRGTGRVEERQRVSARGGGTCYVSLHPDGARAFVANYGGGSVVAFAVGSHEEILPHSEMFSCRESAGCGGLGPVRQRQEGHHMHCAVVSPDGQWLLVCDLGGDAILMFPLRGKTLGEPRRMAMRAGSGPRHVAFHPSGRWVYCINELDCTLEVLDWKPSAAVPLVARAGSEVSTLAAGVGAEAESSRPNTACEVVISDDGRFLYANTRGVNTLAVYGIGADGALTELQRVGSGGSVTRMIALDPSRRWLLCAHQGSSSVTVFAREGKTGRLGAEPRTFAAETPMFLEFV